MNNKKDEDKLLNSNYDGIEEYDNDLPKWWVYLFYITIIASVVYVGYYHYMPGNTNSDKLASDMATIKSSSASTGVAAPASGDALLQLASTDAAKSKGKEVFAAKCAVCHGGNGEGLIGPNLTDKYWINGGGISDIHKTVVNGVVEKGMLAWKGVLSEDDINNVVAFVWSVRNTNVANGKAPQGDPVN